MSHSAPDAWVPPGFFLGSERNAYKLLLKPFETVFIDHFTLFKMEGYIF
jgi:hypothetical protein